MYKLVVLLSLASLVAAKPSAVKPLVPGSSSVSLYSSSVVHGTPTAYGHSVSGVYGNPVVYSAHGSHAVSSHHLHKRSIGVAPMVYSSIVPPYASPLPYHNTVVSPYSTPVVSAYSSPVVSAYSSPVVSAYSSPVVSSYPLSYTDVYPKALSVHPY